MCPATITGVIYFQNSRCLEPIIKALVVNNINKLQWQNENKLMFQCTNCKQQFQFRIIHRDSLHTCTGNN